MKQFNDLIEFSSLFEKYATNNDKLLFNLAYNTRMIWNTEKDKNNVIYIDVNIDSFDKQPIISISNDPKKECNFIKFINNKNYSQYISNNYQLGHLKFEKYQHIKDSVDFSYYCSEIIRKQNPKITSFIDKYIGYINDNMDVILPQFYNNEQIYWTTEKTVNDTVEIEVEDKKTKKIKLKKQKIKKTYTIKHINKDIEKKEKTCVISFNFLQNDQYLDIFEIFQNNENFSFDNYIFSISELINYLNDKLFETKFYTEDDKIYLKSSFLSMKSHEKLNENLSNFDSIYDIKLPMNCENFDIKNLYKISNLNINDYKLLLTAESLFFKFGKRLINDYYILVIPDFYNFEKLNDVNKKSYYINMINYIKGISIESYNIEDEDSFYDSTEESIDEKSSQKFNDFDDIDNFNDFKNNISFNVYIYLYNKTNGIYLIDDCINNLPYSFLLSRINDINKHRKEYNITDFPNDKCTLSDCIRNSMFEKNKSITPLKNTYYKIFFDKLYSNTDLDNSFIRKCDTIIKKSNDKKEQDKLKYILKNYYFLKSFENNNTLFDKSYQLGVIIGKLINKISYLDSEAKENLITTIQALLIDIKRISYLIDVKNHLSVIFEKFLKNNYNTDKIYINDILNLIESIDIFNDKNYIIGFYTGYNNHHMNIYDGIFEKGKKPKGNIFDDSILPQLPLIQKNNISVNYLAEYLIKCMSYIDRCVLSVENENVLLNKTDNGKLIKPTYLTKKNNLYSYILQRFNSLYTLKTNDDIIELIETLYDKMIINKYLTKDFIENGNNTYYIPFFKKYTEDIINKINESQISNDFIFDFTKNFISKYRNLK